MIIFAPGLDGFNYLNSLEVSQDKIHGVFGEMGLLQLLETQLGLHHDESSTYKSFLSYYKALKGNSSGAFFEQSLKVDGLGSTKKVLYERDQLILNGWDQKKCGIKRIDVLAKVESDFGDESSYPIRLKNVRDELSKRKLSKIPKVHVKASLNSLPKLWQDVLSALSKINIEVSFQETKIDPDKNLDIHVVRSINFREASVLVGRAALDLQKQNKKIAFICTPQLKEDLIFGLNYSGIRWTSDRMRSSVAVPELSLFVGVLSLIWKDSSPQSLLSWLRMPFNPIGWKKSRELANALQRDESIEEFAFTSDEDEEQIVKESLLAMQEYFLDLILKPKEDREIGISVNRITEICDAYLNWLKESGRLAKSGAVSVYSQISDFKEQMQVFPEDVVDEHNLAKLVRISFSSGALELQEPEYSSGICIVDDPKRILGSVDCLFWFGYNSSYEGSISRSFWSPEELMELDKNGCKFPSGSSISSTRVLEWINGLTCAKESFLISFEMTYSGEPDYTHPSFDFIGPTDSEGRAKWRRDVEASVHDSKLFKNLPYTEVKARRTHSPKQTWSIPKGLLPQELKWSPSGVERILRCPLAWHLESQKCLNEGSHDRLSDEVLTLGNVGHKFFELFFNVGYQVATTFDKANALAVLSKCSSDVQVLKLWSDIDMTEFRNRLMASAEALHSFLKSNQLEVLENEVWKEKIFSKDVVLHGKMDIVLGNGGGPLLVLDFKTKVSKYRIEDLENGSIQLSLYLEMLSRHDISVGYFDLSNGNIIYSGSGRFKDAKFIGAPKTQDVANETMSIISDKTFSINEGIVSATVITDEDERYKPFCNGCGYSGICGKKFENIGFGS